MALQASLSWETFEQYAFWQVSVNFGTLKSPLVLCVAMVASNPQTSLEP